MKIEANSEYNQKAMPKGFYSNTSPQAWHKPREVECAATFHFGRAFVSKLASMSSLGQ